MRSHPKYLLTSIKRGESPYFQLLKVFEPEFADSLQNIKL